MVKTTPGKPVALQVEIEDDGLGNPALGKVTVEWQPAGDGLILKDPAAFRPKQLPPNAGATRWI